MLEEGPDWSGDDAVFIWLLLDDALSDADLELDKIKPLVSYTRHLARTLARDKVYPYVRVRRVKEWAELTQG